MKFEHVVVINEPGNPLADNLSREELWFGLMCRAEDPRPFLPGLEACTIESRTDTVLERTLRFGQAQIRDRVTLTPMTSVVFESEATDSHPGGHLTISIEEPQPELLVLRFAYRTGLGEGVGQQEDAAYAEFVKSAYHESDIDTVRVIRMITESSRLQ